MKTKKKDLDVDFIGGAAPLTKDEEKKISEIIRKHKTGRKKMVATQRGASKGARRATKQSQ